MSNKPYTYKDINAKKISEIEKIETMISQLQTEIQAIQKNYWIPCYACQQCSPIQELTYVSVMKYDVARGSYYEESCGFQCPFCEQSNYISQELKILKFAFKKQTEIVKKA